MRRTGKSKTWAREFLQDFGRFCEVAAQGLGIRIRDMDRAIALQVMRVELQERDEENETAAEALEKTIADVEVIGRPKRQVSSEELEAIFG